VIKPVERIAAEHVVPQRYLPNGRKVVARKGFYLQAK
jgi:hypothetical protein